MKDGLEGGRRAAGRWCCFAALSWGRWLAFFKIWIERLPRKVSLKAQEVILTGWGSCYSS